MTAPGIETPQLYGEASATVTGLGRGIGWNYARLGSLAITNLVSATLVLRNLGPAEFGVFALITGASGFMNMLGLSLGLSVVRAAAQQHVGTGQEVAARRDLLAANGVYVALAGLAALVMASLAVTLPALIELDESARSSVRGTALLVGAALAVSLATSALAGLATGQQDFRALAVAACVGSTVNVTAVAFLVNRIGLTALGWAELASAVCSSAVMWRWARKHAKWFRLRPGRIHPSDARRVLAGAMPLILVGVGGQVITTTDLFILGGFYSPAVVGLYKSGSLLPTHAVGVLYQGYSVALPALAAANEQRTQEKTVAVLTRVGGYVAGLSFGTIALLRRDVLQILTGGSAALAETILLLFCALYLVTMVAHGISLLLIARGKQRRFVWPTLLEIIVNGALTFLFIHLFEAKGAAIATLVTLGVSHLFLVPVVAKHEFVDGTTRILAAGWLAVTFGVMVAGIAFLPFGRMPPSALRLLAVASFTGVAGALTGLLLLRSRGRRELVLLMRRAHERPTTA